MIKDDQEKMKIRAGLISGWKTETKSSDESQLVVEFLLGQGKYAIDSSFVTEVMSFRKLTRIPQTPAFFVGLMNIRGKIISIISMTRYLNLKEMVAPARNKIIVIHHNQMEFGFVVDEIIGTKQLYMNSLSKLPGEVKGSGTDYIYGVTPDGIIILNAVSILSDPSIIINQK